VRGSIFLVEDSEDDIELTRRALRKNNLANPLVVARDGQEALDYLFGDRASSARDLDDLPAMILLDLKLPRVDGLEVLRRLRAERRTRLLPVIILTSSREERDLIDGYTNGANSYIRKPVDFDQFSEAVRQLGLYWLILNEPPPHVG
jgi:two-component system response regulator